jgi:diadenosine tetraphosphate (Ap4A) HIT family hydrolase
VVQDLNSLTGRKRDRFLEDMAITGDALLEVTDAYRINYEILGNTEPVLHAHIIPRYMAEPEEFRKIPVWSYDKVREPPPKFDAERDKKLMQAIAQAIQKRM